MGSNSGVDTLLLDNFDYEDEDESTQDPEFSIYSTNYKLAGIVVHSGQANGGHYYSFIRNPSSSDDSSNDNQTTENNSDSINQNKATESSSSFGGESEASSSSSSSSNNNSNWFKFDDNDVSEFKMDDEELRNQCYGGEYTGEVYDSVLKRVSYKKQKRWWNAYILFYERIKLKDLPQQQNVGTSSSKQNTPRLDNQQNQQVVSTNSEKGRCPKTMPAYILKSVLKKNIKFLHQRNHFSVEYFQFMKKLIQTNLCYLQQQQPQSSNENASLSIQVKSNTFTMIFFSFSSSFFF